VSFRDETGQLRLAPRARRRLERTGEIVDGEIIFELGR
jgi:hypothetical protein